MIKRVKQKIKTENYATRLLVYFLGLFIMTLGISMSVKSNLGVSPGELHPVYYHLYHRVRDGKSDDPFSYCAGLAAGIDLKRGIPDKKSVAGGRGSRVWLFYNVLQLPVFIFADAREYAAAAWHDAWKCSADCLRHFLLSAGRYCPVGGRGRDESSVGYDAYYF